MSNHAKWRDFSKEDFERILLESRSWAEFAQKLGYSKQGGGTITSLKNAVKEYNLNTEHFLGKQWNKENYDYSAFSINSYKHRGKTMLAPLVKLRGRSCENCGLQEWMGHPINLEVHHIDGDRSNNSLENLKILCPNCHSFTNNYRKRSKFKKNIPDDEFAYALSISKSIRQALKYLGLTPYGDNYSRANEIIQKFNIQHLKNV